MAYEVLGRDIKLDNDDIQFSKSQDFLTVSKRENLIQAISNRFSTMQGEYLLNSNYGSELHTVIGLPANSFIKSAIKGYIINALNSEPRISDFTINEIKINADVAYIDINITATDTQEQFNFVYPYYLQE